MKFDSTEFIFHPARVLAAFCLLVVACVSASAQTTEAPISGKVTPVPTVAGAAPEASAPVVGKPADAGEEASASSKKSGIKVHGHWLIEVKSKDGTVTQRREFENSYVGGSNLGLDLGGFQTIADPAILFFSANGGGAGSLCNGVNHDNVCLLAESFTAGHGGVDVNVNGNCTTTPSGCYSGLTATLMPAGGPYTSWVLSGVVTSQAAGTFDSVIVSISDCYNPGYDSPVAVSPVACYINASTYAQNAITSGSAGPFESNDYYTGTLLPGGAVTVAAGQTLIFTVTISFS